MSNKETLQQNNTKLNTNNTDLKTVLNKVNNLPARSTIEDSILDRSITELVNDRITTIGNYALQASKSLTKLIVPNVTRLEAYSISGCPALQEIDFSSVEFIGQQALASLQIKKLVLPKVQTFYVQSFLAATTEAIVITQSENVASMVNVSAFNASSIAKGTGFIYVPDNLVESYKSATNWSTYAEQIKGLSELPDEYKE